MPGIWKESNPWIMWVFPKIGVPPNGWFIMENPIKMDDLGVPVFLETPMWHFPKVGVLFLEARDWNFCSRKLGTKPSISSKFLMVDFLPFQFRCGWMNTSVQSDKVVPILQDDIGSAEELLGKERQWVLEMFEISGMKGTTWWPKPKHLLLFCNILALSKQFPCVSTISTCNIFFWLSCLTMIRIAKQRAVNSHEATTSIQKCSHVVRASLSLPKSLLISGIPICPTAVESTISHRIHGTGIFTH